MSTPPPMPSPTPRSPSAMPEGPFGGRRAARLRAVVNADLLPRERASADALVLTAWLSAAQRARYAPTLRAGGGVEEFVQRLADERRVVLEEGADEVAGELESAAAAERSARQLPLRLLEGALLLLEAGCGLWIVLLTLDAKDAGTAADLPAQTLPLLLTLATLLALAALVGAVATWVRDRELLDWAVSRPGQLGRGLPLRRRMQGTSAGPVVLGSLGPAALVGAGVLAIVSGAALLLLSLAMRQEIAGEAIAPQLLIGGVIALVTAVLVVWFKGRRLERTLRRERAVEWIGPLPDADEPPSV